MDGTSPESLEMEGMGSPCTFQQRMYQKPLDSVRVFPEMCNLLYSICHLFVHRCILNSWRFLLRYYSCLFYMNIFIILKRSYLNFLLENCTVL